jgi:hypothetical protein
MGTRGIDKDGTMFITDGYENNGRLTRWEKGAKVGETLVYGPLFQGIALDPKEKYLYVIYGGNVVRYTKDGKDKQVVAGSGFLGIVG